MSNREAHLLDRVRETAKRCIDLGVRVDAMGFFPNNQIETDAVGDFYEACFHARFQLAEVAGWDERYTKEDVDQARSDGYSECRREMRYAVND
jgi:hypothetical protein